MIVLDLLRIVLGALFIFLVPGLAWSFVFFTKNQIDWIQRLAVSIGLSVAIVPLTVFWLNWLFHVRITLLNACLIVCVLTAIPTLYLLARDKSIKRGFVAGFAGLLKRLKKHP